MQQGSTGGRAARVGSDRTRGLSVLDRTKLLFFAAAGISFVASVGLWFGGSKEQGVFVGLWVPSILSAGALLTAGARPADE